MVSFKHVRSNRCHTANTVKISALKGDVTRGELLLLFFFWRGLGGGSQLVNFQFVEYSLNACTVWSAN